MGINKQGTAATMETCVRHGKGATGNTVKVGAKVTKDALSLTVQDASSAVKL